MFPWNMLPFNQDTKKLLQQMKPDEIEKYVQDMLQKMFPSQLQNMMNPSNFMQQENRQSQQETTPLQPSTSIEASTFETHHYVFVRVPIKDENWLGKMRIYHSSNQIFIEHIPNDSDKHVITLPAIVRKKGSTTQVLDDILEIKLLKNTDFQFSEIEISDPS